MKSKNPVAKALYICGTVVAILGFFVSLLQASQNLTNLISGVFLTAILAVLFFGLGETVSLLQRILDRMNNRETTVEEKEPPV